MAKVKQNTDKKIIFRTKKKTTIGSGKFSKVPTRKGSTKKKYNRQGR